MKKLASFLVFVLLIAMLASSIVPLSAAAPEGAGIPDLLITEIANDTSGADRGYTNGYTTGNDVFEFLEICNTSDKTVNLYDYALIYNGHGRGNDNFENLIVECTPFKAGDYLDQSSLIPSDGTAFGDLSLRPQNPETCELAPGEVVVVWMMFYECYYADFNEGKGLSMDDFRAHWNLPAGTKVIAVDACTNPQKGGHNKNFNLKNKDTGTYGIARQSAAMNEAANVDGAAGLAGRFSENEDIICWATMDFIDQLPGSVANTACHFTWDYDGYAAKDQCYDYYNDFEPYTYDARREYLLTLQDTPTPGTLSTLQKISLCLPLEAGDSVTFDEAVLYFPILPEEIKGFLIGDRIYALGETFTAETAGIYTLEYAFTDSLDPETGSESETDTSAPESVPDGATDAAETTGAPHATDTTTADGSTAAGTDSASNTVGGTTVEDGCASALGLILLPILLTAGLALRKKN